MKKGGDQTSGGGKAEGNRSRIQVARRAFLAGFAATSAAPSLAVAASRDVPIIDTHIHLFDKSRPQGAPYPEGPQPPGMPMSATPRLYQSVARRLGVVGAIMVEASPWIEDNLWAIQVVEANPFMVGMIGNLQPEKPEFAEYLDRYQRHPLFRGIRYATLWGYDLPSQVGNPVFIDGIRRLAAADLVLETNASPSLLQAVARLTDRVPDLRVVIDHIAGATPAPADEAAFGAALAELGARPNVYAKLSNAITSRSPSTEVGAHRAKLDALVAIFGDDRILFGSDWPNLIRSRTTLAAVGGLMRGYMADKPRAVREKFFWRNSQKAYKWMKRSAEQPA